MTTVNLHEFKSRLSEYARRVKAGETVILCQRNVPIAELRPIGEAEKERPLRPKPGLFCGQIAVGKAFFEADEELATDFFGLEN